jgi:ATP-dependent Lhr-like helicase
VAVRSGDTTPYERQKMVRKPPHILITTPESLALILAAPKFRESFDKVEWVIVDEIHDICDSKRGVFLSLTLERLREHCQNRFTRIGLSATLAPIEAIAGYLVGCDEGRVRDVTLVEARTRKDLDLQVLCPTEDMTALSFEIVNAKMYDLLKELVDEHRTTLIFTNTRSGAESVVYKLKERGLESIEAHHSSLSKEIRLEVEEKLKRGELRCVVSSTSLELGIDIGSVDLVCQVGSPKSVAKGLQRVGRSGHGVGQTAKGRLIVFDQDDLVECAVLCRAAHQGRIDRVAIPENCLDVLAQTLVGMSLDRRWELDEVEALVRGSYCYRNLPRQALVRTLRYLGSKDDFEGVYSKLWFDEEEGRMGRKRGSRMIYFLNLGTIPEEANYKVVTSHGSVVGELSEKFVERLTPKDIFVLGGRSFEFVRAKGMRAYVKEASGKKPTVPSWTGEMLPRSFDLSMDIARFRREMTGRLSEDDDALINWLIEDLDIDEGSARSLISYFREQLSTVGAVPDDRKLLVEEYVDPSDNHRLIFHFPFGRRVNDALSRAFAYRISNTFGVNVSITMNDDNFMVSSPRRLDLERLSGLLSSKDLDSVLRRAVRESELFRQRFRHTATRSFMILRNYRGRPVSVNRQQVRSSYLLESLERMEDVPVIEETYREVLEDDMDIHNARLILETIESGEMELKVMPYTGTPSPFAHNVILSGYSDIVLMEDRSALLRELHRKVLSRAMGDSVREFEFEAEHLVPYFRDKAGTVRGKEDIVPLLMRTGPLQMFRERGRNIYSYADADRKDVDSWCRELLREGALASVFLDDPHFMAVDEAQYYASVCARDRDLNELDERLLQRLTPETGVDLLAAELDVSEDRILRSLRKLESMYLVGRVDHVRGRWSYAPVDHPRPDRDSSLDRVLLRHLQCFAPQTAEEVAYALALKEPEARRNLDALVEEGEVVRGRFLVSEHDQYMLRLDQLRLRTGNSLIFDHASVERYRQSKGARFPDIESYFRFYGWASHTLDVFQRVDGFRIEDWADLRESGRILQGRFVKGKVRYVLDDDADLYVQAFRAEGLTQRDEKVLSMIRAAGGLSARQMDSFSEMDKESLKESVARLDRNMHLVRAYDEREDWASENMYMEHRSRPVKADVWPLLVQRFIRAYGPVSVYALRAVFGLTPEQGRELAFQVGAVPIYVGDASNQMLVMPEEVDRILNDDHPDLEVRILSPQDPDLQSKWADIASRYGERRIYPVLRAANLIGALEIWEMSGCVEVRSMELSSREDLDETLLAVDRLMEYHRMRGISVVRVREVMGQDAAQPTDDDRALMLAHGYHHINGFFAKGDLVPNTFSDEQLISYVIRRQHIPPERRYATVNEALMDRGHFRSEGEMMIRVKEKTTLKRQMEKGYLMSMNVLPPYSGYSVWDHAIVYRAARDAPIDDDMRMLISLIKDRQPVSRREIFDHSTLGQQRTLEALQRLNKGSIVYLDGERRYSLVAMRRMEVHEARKVVMRQLFHGFGVFSAEHVSTFLGPSFGMREVRSILAELEQEGYLVKGFLRRDDPTLYWMLAEDVHGDFPLESVQFLLNHQDNLHAYLRGRIKREYGSTDTVVFSGPRMIGALKGKIGSSAIKVEEFHGDRRAWAVVREAAKQRGLALDLPQLEEDEDDWGLWEFYMKTHPGEF